tara:strand:- start:2532 stop:3155 length:624 start_codon:yes stop_codon:yes gene_type:complete
MNREDDEEKGLATRVNENYVVQNHDRNGNLLRTEFYPSADMYRFAMARASLKNSNLTDREVMAQIGLTDRSLKRWRADPEINVHFEKWLVKCVENFQAPAREALLAFGIDQAFKGKFEYWKEVSKTLGAISHDKVEVTTNVKSIDELNNLSPEELELEKEKLLATLIGVRTSQVASATSPEESASREDRTEPLLSGSMVLPDNVASD